MYGFVCGSGGIMKDFPVKVTRRGFMGTSALATASFLTAAQVSSAQAQQPAAPGGRRPNIVMIMSDDAGIWNISAYHRGMMGGSTPNIDRIAKEGALFTDYYAQQSCTAGRAAFILGQAPFRTGLLNVGLPAAKQGVQEKDPTIAEPQTIGLRHGTDRQEPSLRPQ
jgi:hypothetical protein